MRIEIQNGQCENCKLYCKNCGVCLIYDDAANKRELCRKDFSVSEFRRIEQWGYHVIRVRVHTIMVAVFVTW